MKVVCVDDKPRSPEAFKFPCGYIVAGEIYTVTNTVELDFWGTAYILSEKPVVQLVDGGNPYWLASRFVPLTYYEAEFQVSEAVEQDT